MWADTIASREYDDKKYECQLFFSSQTSFIYNFVGYANLGQLTMEEKLKNPTLQLW